MRLKDWLDIDNKNVSDCYRKNCPSDEQLKLYPMLPEFEFDEVDENLFRCAKCKERMSIIDLLMEAGVSR